MPETRTIRAAGWLETARERWVRRAARLTVIEPVRVGVDIDGVMAPGKWKTPPWHVQNGWEGQPLIDAEGLAELAHRARSNAWEVYAITARPSGPGRSTQQQTRRWLQRHDATELSVVIDRGSRVEIARALELDWLIDDTLEHCTAAQLETSTRSIWIAPEPEREERAEAAFTGCTIAASLEEAVAMIDA